MNLLHLFLIYSQLPVVSPSIIKSTSQSEERELFLSFVAMGVSRGVRGLMDWLTKHKKEPIDENYYSKLLFDVINGKKTKELEMLTFYLKTYERDIATKCKFAVRRKEREDPEMRLFLFQRCEGFARFVFNHAHVSGSLLDLQMAYKFFFNMLNDGLFKFNFHEQPQDALMRNARFLEILESEMLKLVSLEQANWKDEGIYRVDMTDVNSFYGPMFEPLFQVIMKDGKLQRKRVVLSKEGFEKLDKTYGFIPALAENERNRIVNGEPGDGEVRVDNLVRFLQGNYMDPLYDFTNVMRLNP